MDEIQKKELDLRLDNYLYAAWAFQNDIIVIEKLEEARQILVDFVETLMESL